MLVHTDVTKYLEFKGVDGSYVLNKARVEKVPATDYEALRSPLLGLFEKRRLRSFLLCVSWLLVSLHPTSCPDSKIIRLAIMPQHTLLLAAQVCAGI